MFTFKQVADLTATVALVSVGFALGVTTVLLLKK